MRLSEALRISPRVSCAFVGAGGKSALMGRVAAELAGDMPIVLSTTTRIALHQRQLATNHLILQDKLELATLRPFLEGPGTILLTGRVAPGEPKWLGLDPAILEGVRKMVSQAGGVLLIEADGAKGRSLKAPADHEPAIPPFTDLVVVVAGMDAVGQPIRSDSVHRPERVAALLGADESEILTPAAIGLLLASAEGGLQSVPRAAEVRVTLNKVEDDSSEADARQVAAQVLKESRVRAAVLASALGAQAVRSVIGRVPGVVLAAGGSRRIGRSKQLIPWKGKPLVWHAVQTARRAGLDPLVVVVGPDSAGVRQALSDQPVVFVENPSWAQGQSTSVQAGLRSVERVAEAVVFLLCDTPLVTPELIQGLIGEHQQTLTPIVAPRIEGRWANPVLFDRVTFEAFAALRGDIGGRELFERFRMAGISADPRIGLDIDTSADLRKLESGG
ncbi:MAG: selenium cofactor biosynthesis protein YqeC [Anaerolineales bacterium]|nr:selenium cofactor biosynthesis protein YqeC [Anaerolineales bacterium]